MTTTQKMMRWAELAAYCQITHNAIRSNKGSDFEIAMLRIAEALCDERAEALRDKMVE